MECLTALFYLTIGFLLYKLCDYLIRKPIIWGVTTKRVLITGCDTGFGNMLAKQLDFYGIHVFAACLTEDGENELNNACSRRLKTVRMDVTDPASVRKAFREVKQQIPDFMGLWGLVNNAGIAGQIGPAEWMQIKDYQKVVDINLLGLIDVTTTFLPLIKKGRGRIVNMASQLGRISLPGSYPYSVSKYGVECFSDALRRDLYPYGVSVHILEPGFFNTNINKLENYEAVLKEAWARCDSDIKAEYGESYLNEFVDSNLRGFVKDVTSDRVDKVVSAYSHALLARFPRARYVMGLDAKLVLLPIQTLPEWLSDWIVDKLGRKRPTPKVLKEK